MSLLCYIFYHRIITLIVHQQTTTTISQRQICIDVWALLNTGAAGVVVSCKIPILATRVRFPGGAIKQSILELLIKIEWSEYYKGPCKSDFRNIYDGASNCIERGFFMVKCIGYFCWVYQPQENSI